MPATDENLWLEDVDGAAALDWVRARNAQALEVLAQDRGFEALRRDLRSILDSEARIPHIEKLGDHVYNFWRDQAHPAGLWRRTSLDEYRKPEPSWETVIDLDAINTAEGENFVWHGADALPHDYRRCLVALSRGGADADQTREFDLVDKAFVGDGFFRPEAKGSLAWCDADSVYVATDFGPGSMTSSGYARIVKLWTRGTPMGEAVTVFEGEADDLAVAAWRDHTRGFERDFVWRGLGFYENELFLRGADGRLLRIDVPDSAEKDVQREWLTLQLREPMVEGGRSYPAGALLAVRLDALLAGKRDFSVLFEPSASVSLQDAAWTRHPLRLTVLDDVKARVLVRTPRADGGWDFGAAGDAAAIADLGVEALDEEASDAYLETAMSFLQPTTLSLVEVGGVREVLKQLPAFFDASGFQARQHFATSRDGTRVPYFVVAPKELVHDGSHPTLLYGYGGFEVSETPAYSAGVGRGWLSQGGVYVQANIRGGGEYGPDWHRAALREKRPRAYEDFAAVAEDLVARGITSPRRLGIQGGSNGGLLVGNMLVRYPQLFGAVVCQVPLLDMQRYHRLLAGASWMPEYGDPELASDWAFLQGISPYHGVRAEALYPPLLLTTSTRDDRVHPGHARKMAARMREQGHEVVYYENIEGGHGGAANNEQAAFMQALGWTFLRQKLF